MQSKFTLPSYFEDFAKRYIQKTLLGMESQPSILENEDVSDVLLRCLIAVDLREFWENATSAFASVPERGQIELAESIVHAAWLEHQSLATKREANIWQDEFLKSAQKTLDLWKSRPTNLNVDDHAVHFYELFTEQSTEDFDPALNDFLNGENLYWYILAVKRCRYSALDYATHVHGLKGRRKRFVRALSAQLQYRGLEPRVQILARFTSTAFDCEYEESSARKAIKDYSPDEDQYRYFVGSGSESNDSWLNRVYSYLEGEQPDKGEPSQG